VLCLRNKDLNGRRESFIAQLRQICNN